MNNKTPYSKYLFSFVALTYLSFYLLSPFFHYHEEYLKSLGKDKYHSHLFNKVSGSPQESGCHHNIEEDDVHNHPLIISAIVTNLSPRIDSNLNEGIQHYDLIEFGFESNIYATNYCDDFHFSKILKEKCVHSASNVSPPFIFTA